MSLNVIYHLVENDIFEDYMTQLFTLATQYVIIYASNKDESTADSHVRHRCFTDWVETHKPDFRLMNVIKNKYPFNWKHPNDTSFADFYIFQLEKKQTGLY